MTAVKSKARSKTEVARELGQKIAAHLQRFEGSPEINQRKRYDQVAKKWVPDPRGAGDYYSANAIGDRHRVWVIYIAYQGGSYLSIEDARTYLSWLDAGNVGRHYEALREASK